MPSARVSRGTMGKSGILIEFEAFKKRHMKTHPELPMQEAKNSKPWLTTEEMAPLGLTNLYLAMRTMWMDAEESIAGH